MFAELLWPLAEEFLAHHPRLRCRPFNVSERERIDMSREDRERLDEFVLVPDPHIVFDEADVGRDVFDTDTRTCPGTCGLIGLRGWFAVGSMGPRLPIGCISTSSAPIAVSVAALNAWCGTSTFSSVQYSRKSVTRRHGTVLSPPYEWMNSQSWVLCVLTSKRADDVRRSG